MCGVIVTSELFESVVVVVVTSELSESVVVLQHLSMSLLFPPQLGLG